MSKTNATLIFKFAFSYVLFTWGSIYEPNISKREDLNWYINLCMPRESAHAYWFKRFPVSPSAAAASPFLPFLSVAAALTGTSLCNSFNLVTRKI